jgi:hypothetical protein
MTSGLPVLTGLSSAAAAAGNNAAIMQRELNTGGFTLPAGVWPCSKTLIPPIACAIEGAGSYRSVIQQVTPGQAGLTLVDGQRLTLSGVGFTGPGTTGPVAAGISMTRAVAANTPLLFFEDVVVQQFSGNGIDGPEANVIVSTFNRVVCESLGGFGFSLTGVPGGAAGTSVSFNSCYAVACGKAGYSLMKMCYSSLNACACDSSGAGYVFQDCQGVALTACGAESLAATGTDMYSDGTNFRVDGCDGVDFGNACWTYGNSHYVLHVSGGSVNVKADRIGENSPAAVALGYALVDSGSQLG